MTPRPAKIKLCADCKREGSPWRYDDDGNCLGKHDCAAPAGSPEAERDAALTLTTEANSGALRAALRIIHDHATTMPTLTANDCRAAMTVAQVPGPVVGAAFRQAAKNGWITRVGYVASTQVETHGHPVVAWESLIYRASRVSGGAA